MSSFDQRAKRDAQNIRNQAFWHQVGHDLRGVPNELLRFSAVRGLLPTAEHYGGTKPILIDEVVGSVDRYRDFDHHFLPKAGHTLDRWASVRRAGLEGKELPAISAYKVGQTYFVKDGHHRVSVARSAGQKYIDAEIVELTVTVPPDSRDTVKELILKGEYAKFLGQNRLAAVVPDHYPIVFTFPGRYDVLLDHIATRQYYLGVRHRREVGWEEAVASWHDRLYKRVVDESRAHKVLERFPERTEADLYLWIMDHRYYLNQAAGEDVGSERAAVSFAARHAPSFVTRTRQRLAAFWRGGRHRK